jgi:ribosomal protein S18 acetylase RimI-like enzyme
MPHLMAGSTGERGITMLTHDDRDAFLALAARERWISSNWELEFLCSSFPAGCLACRTKGIPVAFVTAIKHDRSGWIGNLLVQQEWRKQGIGTALFSRVLAVLEDANVETVWLTASADGKRLYERHGFTAIDTISRWQRFGEIKLAPCQPDWPEILSIDMAGWGDRRESLLQTTSSHGRTAAVSDGFMVLQQGDDCIQLGPWGCTTPAAAAELLGRVLCPDTQGARIVLDVPEGNSAAANLLRTAGFTRQSATVLMYRGTAPAYVPQHIFSLASMGSMG